MHPSLKSLPRKLSQSQIKDVPESEWTPETRAAIAKGALRRLGGVVAIDGIPRQWACCFLNDQGNGRITKYQDMSSRSILTVSGSSACITRRA